MQLKQLFSLRSSGRALQTDNRKQLFCAACCDSNSAAQLKPRHRVLHTDTHTDTHIYTHESYGTGHVSLSMRWAFCAPTNNTLKQSQTQAGRHTARRTDRQPRQQQGQQGLKALSLSFVALRYPLTYIHIPHKLTLLNHSLTHTVSSATSCRYCCCCCCSFALISSLVLLMVTFALSVAR